MAMLTTLGPEDLVPAEHPIRRIRKVVDDVLASLDPEFEAMYSGIGHPSVPPEQLLEATVLLARTRSDPSGPSASGSTTTCCSSGSWTCPSTLRSLS